MIGFVISYRKNAPCISPSLVDISASICFYYTALQERFASETDLSPTVTSQNVGSAYLFNINSYMNVTSTKGTEKNNSLFQRKGLKKIITRSAVILHQCIGKIEK